MPIFGVAVIMQPTKKEREEGEEERLVFGPKWDMGRDGQAVALKVLLAAKSAGELPADVDMARAEVKVSPFA